MYLIYLYLRVVIRGKCKSHISIFQMNKSYGPLKQCFDTFDIQLWGVLNFD